MYWRFFLKKFSVQGTGDNTSSIRKFGWRDFRTDPESWWSRRSRANCHWLSGIQMMMCSCSISRTNLSTELVFNFALAISAFPYPYSTQGHKGKHIQPLDQNCCNNLEDEGFWQCYQNAERQSLQSLHTSGDKSDNLFLVYNLYERAATIRKKRQVDRFAHSLSWICTL